MTSRLEEAQNGWSAAQQQLEKLQAAFRKMEKEKNELIQVKTACHCDQVGFIMVVDPYE